MTSLKTEAPSNLAIFSCVSRFHHNRSEPQVIIQSFDPGRRVDCIYFYFRKKPDVIGFLTSGKGALESGHPDQPVRSGPDGSGRFLKKLTGLGWARLVFSRAWSDSCVCVCVCVCMELTAQLRSLVAVVQTVIVSVTLPALLDAAVVLAGKLSGLALRRGHVGRVGCGGRRGGINTM